jgi:hypothetical protein
MKKVLSILVLASIFMISCQKEELNQKEDYSFVKIINATCINDYGVIVPCKVTNKGDILEMDNSPIETNGEETRIQGSGIPMGGFCVTKDEKTGTYCPNGDAQPCRGNYECTVCVNC